jgi:hypothetical protein
MTTNATQPETQDDTPNRKRPAYVPAYRVSLVREPSVRMEARPVAGDSTAAVRAILAIRSGHDDGIEHFGILLLDVRHLAHDVAARRVEDGQEEAAAVAAAN